MCVTNNETVAYCLSHSSSLFHLHQLVFEAHAEKLCPRTEIKVTNVTFTNCHAGYYPFSPTGNFNLLSVCINYNTDFHIFVSKQFITTKQTFFGSGLSCNFEEGLCGWYQDSSDNFDWTVVSGMDHTISVGELMDKDEVMGSTITELYINLLFCD